MADDRQITDCEHYMRGNCRWGFECLFRHPAILHEPQVVCKFWQTYSCTNKFCQFLHPAVLPTTYPAPVHKSKHHTTSKEPAILKDTSNTVCAYYMSGRCSKSACPFLHSLPETVSSRHPQSCKSATIEFSSEHWTYVSSNNRHYYAPETPHHCIEISRSNLFILSASAVSSDHGQKRQAPDVLSKYSFRHSVEENATAIANRKMNDLDDKLEKYQKAGALSSKNNAPLEESEEILLLTKKTKNEDSSSNSN